VIPSDIIGFYFDQNVAVQVATQLRYYGHHATTARDEGQTGVGDDRHLLMASLRGWTLVTHDRNDFSLLHDAWRRWSVAWQVTPLPQHAGVLVIPQGRWSAAEAARELDSFVRAGHPRTNELYHWQPGPGWVQQP